MNPTGVSDSALGVILIVLGALIAVGIVVPFIVFGIGFFARLIGRTFACIGGIIGDVCCAVGNVVAAPFSLGTALVNLLFGRMERADRAARMFQERLVWLCRRVWSAAVQRPLRVVGIQVPPRMPRVVVTVPPPPPFPGQKAPPAPGAAPWPDPAVALGTFPGYQVESRLPTGGSGAKLYVAQPDQATRARLPGRPERVVIKSFAIGEGSTVPQIVRENRALDAARSLGLVLEHRLEPHRFWYAMPHYPGQSLGTLATQKYRAAGAAMPQDGVRELVGYVADVVASLRDYHQGGLWHKDVKPDNIIVANGRAHLIDIGLITPLASTFTLTTHGTEYFRDPEMVRQALRGAKVNEVDGSRFDVYSAGAVLYSVLENTFPAHGALSAFERPSPEALRWIVRRSMAEYGKRYASAAHMLADLRWVLAAPNMDAVRPAELPSMRDGAAAGMPAPPAPAAAAAAAAAVPAGAAMAHNLREAFMHFGLAARRAAHEARARVQEHKARQQAARMVVGVRVPPGTRVHIGRSAAAVAAAASASAQAQARQAVAAARKAASGGHWSPWATAAVATVAVAAGTGFLATSVRAVKRGPAPVTTVTERASSASPIPKGSGRLLVQRAPGATGLQGDASSRMQRTLDAWGTRGWEVVDDDTDALASVALLTGAEPAALKAELERRGYAGLLRVDVKGSAVTTSLVKP